MNKKLLIVMILGMFLITGVSAELFSFDNFKQYNEETRTITVVNTFGLGKDLAEIQLLTPLENVVNIGYSKVAEFRIKGFTDYPNWFKNIEFYNLKRNWEEETIVYDFRMEVEYEETLDRMVENCNKSYFDVNGTTICHIVKDGTYQVTKSRWDKITPGNIKENEEMVIGIFTNVEPGDYKEWIPEIYGIKINEWASWLASNTRQTQLETDILQSSITQNYSVGIKITVGGADVKLTKVSKFNGGTETICRVLNNDGSSVLANANYVGNDATFDFVLNASTNYTIMSSKTDSSFSAYRDGSETFPTDMTEVSLVSGFQGTAGDTSRAWSIESLDLALEADVPVVTLNSPANETNTAIPTVNFNGTITGVEPVNVSLIIDGIYNETNSTGGLGDYLFTKILSEGDHIWNYEACTIAGFCVNGTETRHINHDATNPEISITSPTDTQSLLEIGSELFLNFTAIDENLDTCFWDYNNTNYTVACTNATLVSIPISQESGDYDVTVYANDTFGNWGSSITSWTYALFKEYETYQTSIVEGGIATFTLGVITNGTDISIANLSYSGEQNIGTLSQNGNNFSISKSIYIPNVDADINNTFFWKITQGSTITSLDSNNQTVLNLDIDDCSANTNVLYNFTIVDEQTQTKLVPGTQNTTGKVDLQINSLTNGQVLNFSNSYPKENSYAVCTNVPFNNGESYLIDLQTEYGADEYATEFFNIQSSTITNSSFTQNITLYDLVNTTAQVFTITYRDSSYLPVKDALMTVQRKYIDEGVFKTIEAPVTDSSGQTLVNLELYDAIYTFIFSKDGVILSTFDNIRARCENLVLGQCEYTFNAVSAPVNPTKYTVVDGISYVLSYDNTTRVVSGIFTIEDGTLKTVSLNVTLLNSLNSAVCSNQLTSSSGTVSCTIPTKFNNGSAIVKIYQDNVFEGQAQVFLGMNNKSLYGGSLVFLSIFMVLTFVGIGINGDPKIAGIFLFLAALVGLGMNLTANTGVIGAGATVLWLLIAIILVIVKGSRRQ